MHDLDNIYREYAEVWKRHPSNGWSIVGTAIFECKCPLVQPHSLSAPDPPSSGAS
jgi:hypothetical protein